MREGVEGGSWECMDARSEGGSGGRKLGVYGCQK